MNSPMQGYTDALRQRRDIETRLGHARDDLKARETFLTPTGEGYKSLGSNDTDRKNVLEKSFFADEICKQVREQIRAMELTLAGVQANIEVFEASRRQNEWNITNVLTRALEKRYSFSNPGLDAGVTETVTAAVEQAEEDREYWEWLDGPAVTAPEQAPIDEIPF